MEQVAQRLGRGLSLEDLDGLLLAYSSNQSHADRVRVNFLLSKRVPVDVIAWQLSHGIATAVRPVVVPANADLGMLGRVCVPLLVRGFRVGYLWVQLDAEEPSAATVLAQLPDVAPELEQLSSLLLDSNTAESEFRRRREQEFLAACAGEANAGGGRRRLERGPGQGALAAGDRPGRRWLGRRLGSRSPTRSFTAPRRCRRPSAWTPHCSAPARRPTPWCSSRNPRDARTTPRCWCTTSWNSPNAPGARSGGSSWAPARDSPSRGNSPRPTGSHGRRPRPRRWIRSWASSSTAGPPASTSSWPRPAAARGPGRTRDPCISASSRTMTATTSCCPCWSCSTTTTARSRKSRPSCTCTGAASTTGSAGSASCWAWTR